MEPLRRLLRTSRLTWLLVLALWLPAAQCLAATHILAHLQQVAPDTHPGGLAACDVAVASLQATAPPATVAPALCAVLPRVSPAAHATGIAAAGAPLAYCSRAPPLPHA
jgi:hypothetical protein